MNETYTPGYTPNAVQLMSSRTFEQRGWFTRDLLRPGMNILDCGCGPGTITQGLAEAVVPGKVMGIDLSEGQIALARESFGSIPNLEFKAGSIYELPFEEGRFDAAYSHALFEHLAKTRKGGQGDPESFETRRISGYLSPRLERIPGRSRFPRDPRRSRFLRATPNRERWRSSSRQEHRDSILRSAGFEKIDMTAQYECYGSLPSIAEYLAQRIEDSIDSDGKGCGGCAQEPTRRVCAIG